MLFMEFVTFYVVFFKWINVAGFMYIKILFNFLWQVVKKNHWLVPRTVEIHDFGFSELLRRLVYK